MITIRSKVSVHVLCFSLYKDDSDFSSMHIAFLICMLKNHFEHSTIFSTLGEIIMNQIIKIAWDLNDNCENRYGLVYEIAELAKKLVDENQSKRAKDEFGFDEYGFDNSIKKENPVEHAIMVKTSEIDDSGLVG